MLMLWVQIFTTEITEITEGKHWLSCSVISVISVVYNRVRLPWCPLDPRNAVRILTTMHTEEKQPA